MEKETERAHWHSNSGQQFYEAFYVLISSDYFDAIHNFWKNKEVENPSYYCAGLAIEHLLKGYLSLRKIKFGKSHDLVSLVSLGDQKIKDFFWLNSSDIKQITLLNERYYEHKDYGKYDLRYPSKPGLRKSPHPDILNKLIKKMKNKLIAELQKN